MEPIQALAYGAVQGLTEFLPISSSGHLVLIGNVLGIESTGVTLEVMVHFGTLLAVLAVYWKDIHGLLVSVYCSVFSKSVGHDEKVTQRGNMRLICLLVVATLPAAILGLLLKSRIERFYESPTMVGVMLFVTGIVLLLVSRVRPGVRAAWNLGFLNAFGIGIAQAFAMIPGISRSGMTITSGLLSGLDREEAARFSFLMSIPVILGATVLEVKDISFIGLDSLNPVSLVIAVCAAFVSGYLAIKIMLRVLQTGNLRVFGYYCWIISGLVVLSYLH